MEGMPSLENADGTHSRSQETKAVRLFSPIECQTRQNGWRCQSGIQRIFLFGSDLTAEDPLRMIEGQRSTR
jgi:hypothetical protein